MWKSKWLKEWQFVQRHIWHTGCVPKAWKQKSSSLVGSSNGGSVGPQLELGAQEDHKPPVNNVSSSWHSPRQNPVKHDMTPWLFVRVICFGSTVELLLNRWWQCIERFGCSVSHIGLEVTSARCSISYFLFAFCLIPLFTRFPEQHCSHSLEEHSKQNHGVVWEFSVRFG